ncbi:class I SAM-dependent methyltransferase [Hansschlegelia sp. KR7-227]|uniref:class I SAM-dependent methyltransferase n=1 Tax=Hansschlegelia sp. KR7-227 TaxID=3400914 RepID=UPI003C059376
MLATSELITFLQGEPWNNLTYVAPPPARDVVGMSDPIERKLLSWLTSALYAGVGEIVELGTFLGASSVSLASGLQSNPHLRPEQKSKRINVFDQFKGTFESDYITKYTKFTLDEDGGFLGIHAAQTAAFKDYLKVTKANVSHVTWDGRPIELLYVDVMKDPFVTANVVRQFFPSLDVGSILIMQDYLFHTLPYSVVVMEYFEEYFTRGGDTGRGNVIFVCHKKVPATMTAEFTWLGMTRDQRLHYLMQAMSKQRTHLHREFVAHLISDFVTGKYT